MSHLFVLTGAVTSYISEKIFMLTPANVVAVGNPCRVMREIGEHDREYYFKERRIEYENL